MTYRFIYARLSVALVVSLLLVVVLMAAGGASYTLASPPATDFQPPQAEDFSALSWS